MEWLAIVMGIFGTKQFNLDGMLFEYLFFEELVHCLLFAEADISESDFVSLGDALKTNTTLEDLRLDGVKNMHLNRFVILSCFSTLVSFFHSLSHFNNWNGCFE